MNLARLVVIFCFIISIVSCASSRSGLKELPLPPQKLVHKGFSLLPPDEIGWRIVHRSHHRLELGRRGKGVDESYAIQVWTLKLPTFHGIEEFRSYVSQRMAKDTGETRFMILEKKESLYEENHGKCILLNTKAEDSDALKNMKDLRSMVLEIISLICRHPGNTNAGIYMAYSNRYYPENSSLNLNDKALSVFRNIEFTGL